MKLFFAVLYIKDDHDTANSEMLNERLNANIKRFISQRFSFEFQRTPVLPAPNCKYLCICVFLSVSWLRSLVGSQAGIQNCPENGP